MASTTTNAAPEVHQRDEAIPTDRVDVVEGESLPFELVNLPSGDCTPDPSIGKEKERRKKKVAIVKKAHKVHPDEPDRGSNED
ncbi:hypothetical protein COCNU_01G016730 [Cocos nucifera]|uniref:Uncharacterized protein n=1 Tax=Cocos nucifera TaxID=13894 RepID=A0A8K0HX20_COCNU|nr:hypothetical protein COCNU_01G016730 [Cocos nucifera]